MQYMKPIDDYDKFCKWLFGVLKNCEDTTKLKLVHRTGAEMRDVPPETLWNDHYIIRFDLVHFTTTIVNTRTGKFGFARCSSYTPSFSYLIGAAVAWRKYCNESVPLFNGAWSVIIE